MRFARWYSTTVVRRYAQQLYAPYIPPLNKEQQKVIRAVELKTLPSVSSKYTKAVPNALAVHSRPPLQTAVRKRALAAVKQALQPLGGDDFEVEDITLLSQRYDLFNFPIEFAIVDKKYPQGIPPDTEIPPIYDRNRVAQALADAGFTGRFYDSNRDMTLGKGKAAFFQCLPWEQEVIHTRRYQLLYPDILQFECPAPLDVMSFDLTLPGPTVLPLRKWLSSQLSRKFSQLLGTIWLIARYNELDYISPMMLAMMVTRFRLDCCGSPAPFPGKKEQLVWVPYETPKRTAVPVQVDVSFLRADEDPKHKIGKLLHGFFSFYGKAQGWAEFSAVCVREGGTRGVLPLRHAPYRTTVSPDPPRLWNRKTHTMFAPHHLNGHALFIRDPFLPTHNHASLLSLHGLHRFYTFCDAAAKRIGKGQELHALLSVRVISRDNVPTDNVSISEDAEVPSSPLSRAREAMLMAKSGPPDEEWDELSFRPHLSANDKLALDSETQKIDMEELEKVRLSGWEDPVDVAAKALSESAGHWASVVELQRQREKEWRRYITHRRASLKRKEHDADELSGVSASFPENKRRSGREYERSPHSSDRTGDVQLDDSHPVSTSMDFRSPAHVAEDTSRPPDSEGGSDPSSLERIPFVSRQRGWQSNFTPAVVRPKPRFPHRQHESALWGGVPDGSKNESGPPPTIPHKRLYPSRSFGLARPHSRSLHTSCVSQEAGVPLVLEELKKDVGRSTGRDRFQQKKRGRTLDPSKVPHRIYKEDTELRIYLKSLHPSDEVLRAREMTRKRIQSVLQSNYGPKYTVEFFGSTRYGVSSASSDLDLVVLDPDRRYGDVSGKKKGAIYHLKSVAAVLRSAGFVIKIVISNASVPIIKFTDPLTGLECDMNVNERLGLLNSEMLKAYCNLSPLLRPMLQVIKAWAKPLGLNNPSTDGQQRTFSSYALALMTIGFLQSKGLLPNLQQNLPSVSLRQRNHGLWSFKGNFWDTRFYGMPGWKPPEKSEISLNDCVLQWFRFWGREFHYECSVVDIREGGILVSNGEPHSPDKNGPTCMVVDPFILTKNVTRGISTQGIDLFIQACRLAEEQIESGTSIVTLLCLDKPHREQDDHLIEDGRLDSLLKRMKALDRIKHAVAEIVNEPARSPEQEHEIFKLKQGSDTGDVAVDEVGFGLKKGALDPTADFNTRLETIMDIPEHALRQVPSHPEVFRPRSDFGISDNLRDMLGRPAQSAEDSSEEHELKR